MPSTFFGLELGKRALSAQQLALDVTGHNISNASSENYTRQVVNFNAPTPYTINGVRNQLTLGTGVELGSITRARSVFVDKQYRTQTSLEAYWSQKQDGLSKIEGIMNEPSENSLHGDMDALWTAFGDLANNPENVGARAVVQERAIAVSDAFHQITNQVDTLKEDFQNGIKIAVSQVNVISNQIGSLNSQIKNAEVNGDNPNDLKDQRDALVDKLSKYFNISVIETRDHSFTDREVNNFAIKIGDRYLVNDSLVNNMKITGDPPSSINDVQWSDGAGSPLQAGEEAGSIQGNFFMINYLDQLKGKFNQLAQGLADAVNQIHQQGYDLNGLPVNGQPWEEFFVFGDPANPAGSITLQTDIKNDLTKIAAAGAGPLAPGENTAADGDNALKIASLKDGWDEVMSLKGTTDVFKSSSFSDYYGSVIAGLGVDAQGAERMVSGLGVLVTHLGNQRQSFSGVSLDEEMTNLVKYQKSYNAAARMVTMMDDMLDTIVNRMGITR